MEAIKALLESKRAIAVVVGIIMLVAQYMGIDIDEQNLTAGVADVLHAIATLVSLAIMIAGWVISDGIRETKRKPKSGPDTRTL